MIQTMLEELSKIVRDRLCIRLIDVSAKEITEAYAVQRLSTILFICSGVLADRLSTAMPKSTIVESCELLDERKVSQT
jgi:hypothetical protein